MKALFVSVVLLFAGVGCSTGIRPDAIDGLVEKICERHDAMLAGTLDPKAISDADKETYRRSTHLIREIIKKAKE